MIRQLLCTIIIAGIAFAGVEESFQRVLTRNFDVPDSNIVVIFNPAGVTSIRTSDREDIVFRYRLYADAGNFNRSRDFVTRFTSRIQERGGVLEADFGLPFELIDKLKFSHLDGDFDGDLEWRGRKIEVSHKKGNEMLVELEMEIPEGIEVRYDGMIGRIDVVGFEGEMRIELSAGEIEFMNTYGNHNITVNDGRVEVENGSGNFNIVAGRMKFSGEFGRIDTLKVVQNSGSIEISRIGILTSYDMQIGNADIRLSADNVGCGKICAGDGDVTVEIKGKIGCEMNIETHGGKIEIKSAWPFANEKYSTISGAIGHQGIESESKTVEIVNPGGSGIVRVESQSGDIIIDY